MMITISLMGVFFGTVWETVITGLRTVNASDDRSRARQELANAFELMAREASVADIIDRAETAELQFDTPSLSDVEYLYDGAADTLTRDDGSTSARVILRNLTDFDFDYVDCVGTSHTGTVAASDADEIRVVQVLATVTRDTETVSMTQAIFFRNAVGQDSASCSGA